MDSNLFVFFTTVTGWRVKYSEEHENVFFSAANTERGIAELAASIKQEIVFWVHLIHTASHRHPYADVVWPPNPCAMEGTGSSTMLLFPIFHLFSLTHSYFFKVKNLPQIHMPMAPNRLLKIFIAQLYSPFHSPINKTTMKRCTALEGFPQLFKIKISLTIKQVC